MTDRQTHHLLRIFDTMNLPVPPDNILDDRSRLLWHFETAGHAPRVIESIKGLETDQQTLDELMREAAAFGWSSAVVMLFTVGADVNATAPNSGKAPIHFAGDHTDTVEVLLMLGADPDSVPSHASLAVRAAAERWSAVTVDAGMALQTPPVAPASTSRVAGVLRAFRGVAIPSDVASVALDYAGIVEQAGPVQAGYSIISDAKTIAEHLALAQRAVEGQNMFSAANEISRAIRLIGRLPDPTVPTRPLPILAAEVPPPAPGYVHALANAAATMKVACQTPPSTGPALYRVWVAARLIHTASSNTGPGSVADQLVRGLSALQGALTAGQDHMAGGEAVIGHLELAITLLAEKGFPAPGEEIDALHSAADRHREGLNRARAEAVGLLDGRDPGDATPPGDVRQAREVRAMVRGLCRGCAGIAAADQEWIARTLTDVDARIRPGPVHTIPGDVLVQAGGPRAVLEVLLPALPDAQWSASRAGLHVASPVTTIGLMETIPPQAASLMLAAILRHVSAVGAVDPARVFVWFQDGRIGLAHIGPPPSDTPRGTRGPLKAHGRLCYAHAAFLHYISGIGNPAPALTQLAERVFDLGAETPEEALHQLAVVDGNPLVELSDGRRVCLDGSITLSSRGAAMPFTVQTFLEVAEDGADDAVSGAAQAPGDTAFVLWSLAAARKAITDLLAADVTEGIRAAQAVLEKVDRLARRPGPEVPARPALITPNMRLIDRAHHLNEVCGIVHAQFADHDLGMALTSAVRRVPFTHPLQPAVQAAVASVRAVVWHHVVDVLDALVGLESAWGTVEALEEYAVVLHASAEAALLGNCRPSAVPSDPRVAPPARSLEVLATAPHDLCRGVWPLSVAFAPLPLPTRAAVLLARPLLAYLDSPADLIDLLTAVAIDLPRAAPLNLATSRRELQGRFDSFYPHTVVARTVRTREHVRVTVPEVVALARCRGAPITELVGVFVIPGLGRDSGAFTWVTRAYPRVLRPELTRATPPAERVWIALGMGVAAAAAVRRGVGLTCSLDAFFVNSVADDARFIVAGGVTPNSHEATPAKLARAMLSVFNTAAAKDRPKDLVHMLKVRSPSRTCLGLTLAVLGHATPTHRRQTQLGDLGTVTVTEFSGWQPVAVVDLALDSQLRENSTPWKDVVVLPDPAETTQTLADALGQLLTGLETLAVLAGLGLLEQKEAAVRDTMCTVAVVFTRLVSHGLQQNVVLGSRAVHIAPDRLGAIEAQLEGLRVHMPNGRACAVIPQLALTVDTVQLHVNAMRQALAGDGLGGYMSRADVIPAAVALAGSVQFDVVVSQRLVSTRTRQHAIFKALMVAVPGHQLYVQLGGRLAGGPVGSTDLTPVAVSMSTGARRAVVSHVRVGDGVGVAQFGGVWHAWGDNTAGRLCVGDRATAVIQEPRPIDGRGAHASDIKIGPGCLRFCVDGEWVVSGNADTQRAGDLTVIPRRLEGLTVDNDGLMAALTRMLDGHRPEE